MEISLIRHGKSRCVAQHRIAVKDVAHWIECYDDSGVFEEHSFPPETLKRVTEASMVVTSDLHRSIESARLLNSKAPIISLPLFREAELPILSDQFGKIKLTPNEWIVILRGLWLAGYSRECESLNQAKQRARTACEQLVSYVHEYESIAVVGHGFFNQLIAKKLRQMGWKGGRITNRQHWGCTTYFMKNSQKHSH